MASQLTMEEETRELVKEEETSNKSIEVVNSSGAIVQELVIGVNKPLIKTDQFPGEQYDLFKVCE